MRLFVLCCVLLLLQKAALAQHPHDQIDTNNINLPFLEYLVKVKIDSVRKSRALNPLINDSILLMASRDHSAYLDEIKEITHYHKHDPNKKSPQKRAEFFGAKDYFVGENIAKIYLYTPTFYAHEKSDLFHEVTSYDQAAHEFIVNWVNSRGHFANILTENYEITAVGLSYDSKDKALYAVQMFAEVSKDYELKANAELFPYDHISYEKLKKNLSAELEAQEHKLRKRFEYGLKRATKSHHCAANTDRVFNSDLIQPYVGGNEIGICTYDLARLKRFFRYRKDGLALEIIGFSQAFACGDSIAESEKEVLKGESLFAGELTRPMFRNDIIKQIKQHELEQKGKRRDRNRCFQIVLANTPEDFYTEHKEVKLVIIKRKRVCSIMSFRSLCGNLISYQVPEIEMDFNFEEVSDFKPKLPEEKVIQKVRFEKNSIDFDESLLDTLVEVLKNPEIQMTSLDIKAFASIEGNINDNKGLYQARAFGVLKAIEDKLGREVIHHMSAEENWRDFKRDISMKKEYKYLQNMDSVSIRGYLKENAKKLEPLLADHRYTYVRLKYSPKLESENITMYAADEFNTKVLRFRKSKKIPPPVFERLMKIQSYLFQEALENGDKYYDSLFIPDNGEFFPLFFRNIQFRYHAGYMDQLAYFVELEKLRKRTKSDLVNTAYKVFLINNSGNELYSEYLTPGLISELISELEERGGDSTMISELRVLYHFSRANAVYTKYGGRNLKRAKSSLKFIYNHFAEKEMHKRFKYTLARYFVLFYKFDYALELLEKNVLTAEPDPFELSLYLKIMAVRDMESPSDDFRQLLVTALNQLGSKQWCGMFIGQCNIPMDIFEFDNILKLYCEECKQ